MAKLNIGKMRRHMARTTPDAVWRDFNRLESDDKGMFLGYTVWASHWQKMMKIKHEGKAGIINTYQSENPGNDKIRIQLVYVEGNR